MYETKWKKLCSWLPIKLSTNGICFTLAIKYFQTSHSSDIRQKMKLKSEFSSAKPTLSQDNMGDFEDFGEVVTKIKRHPDFARFEKPFGLEQHIFNSIFLALNHGFGFYAWYLTLTGTIPVTTLLFDLLFAYWGNFGVTIGTHRYWTHRSFKANKFVQVLLMIMQTSAMQYPIHKWCLEHRIHHRYVDTDADPHNSKRGLYHSHIGWLFCPKHPTYKKKWDPIVRFQSRWYWTLTIIFYLVLPVSLLRYFWNMPLLYCLAVNCRRYIYGLHTTWIVNSLAHKYGDKPYDKSIRATDNAFVSFLDLGEGWHNYHHTFPWDYKTSELGWKINPSTMLIDLFAWLGWVSDMKTVSQKMIIERLRRTGDGSHDAAIKSDGTAPSEDVTNFMKQVEHPVWGWGDEKMTKEFLKITEVLKPTQI